MMKKILVICLFVIALQAQKHNVNAIQSNYFKSYDYEQMGKYEEAIKVLIPLYKKYPKGYTLNLRFGWLFYLSKKYTNAVKYYKNASLIQPASLEAKLGLTRVYLATASYADAQIFAYEILKTDYYNYYGNLYAIKALIAQKKYDIALKITQKMLALYPTDVLFLQELARIYKATRSPYLQKLYQDILILDPNNVLVRNN